MHISYTSTEILFPSTEISLLIQSVYDLYLVAVICSNFQNLIIRWGVSRAVSHALCLVVSPFPNVQIKVLSAEDQELAKVFALTKSEYHFACCFYCQQFCVSNFHLGRVHLSSFFCQSSSDMKWHNTMSSELGRQLSGHTLPCS